MPPASMCLVFILDLTRAPGQVLLGLKHHGIGASNVVGLGGHVEPGETAAEAAIREAEEEAGVCIPAESFLHRGQVRFRFPARPKWDQDVEVFTTTTWEGEPGNSDEITPAWYPISDLPTENMWDDAQYWLPQVLDDGAVDITVTFGSDNRRVAGIMH